MTTLILMGGATGRAATKFLVENGFAVRALVCNDGGSAETLRTQEGRQL